MSDVRINTLGILTWIEESETVNGNPAWDVIVAAGDQRKVSAFVSREAAFRYLERVCRSIASI